MSEYIVKCTEIIGISGNILQIPDYIDLNSEVVRCRDCAKFSEQEPNGEHAWGVKWKEDANRKLSEKLEEYEARIRELEEMLLKEKGLVKDLLDACGECDQLRKLELRIHQLEKEARNE